MKENNLPPDWDQDRIRRVLAHYEQQTEAEAIAEDEAAAQDEGQILLAERQTQENQHDSDEREHERKYGLDASEKEAEQETEDGPDCEEF